VVTPDILTYEHARRLVELRTTNDDAVRAALAYVIARDIWQDGNGWIGPQARGDAGITEELRRGLAGENLLLEFAARHVAAVIGRDPDWTIDGLINPAPPPEDDDDGVPSPAAPAEEGAADER
jgi:hypothetical protein